MFAPRAVALIMAVGLFASCSPPEGPPEPRAEPSPAPTGSTPSISGKWFEKSCKVPIAHLERSRRGYVPERSPDVMFIPKEPNFFSGYAHSGPWDYVQRVPLVLYGPGYIESVGEVRLDREPTVADLAPTFAELLDIEWPRGRDGRVLDELLVPAEERPAPPPLLITIVWDGAGWNVLDEYPDSWPFLSSLMDSGASLPNAIVGSSPSVTPPIHATIGTGVFPRRHGIVDVPVRIDGRMTDSWDAAEPKYLRTTTLADIYDPLVDNVAQVGMFAERAWHLGMIGHGSGVEGADRDLAAFIDRRQPGVEATVRVTPGGLVTNEDYYYLPSDLQDEELFERYVRQVDLEDGRLDSLWLGNDMLEDPVDTLWTPVWALYQTTLIKRMIRNENFGDDEIGDLLYVNYKQIDHVGHEWTLTSEEMVDAVEHADAALKELVTFLDREIGTGRWVLALTADHGLQPLPEEVGAWKIDQDRLTEQVENNFGEGIVDEDRPLGLWLDHDVMEANGVTAEEVASYVIQYAVEDEVADEEEIPEGFRPGEKLFAAAFPMASLDDVMACARERS